MVSLKKGDMGDVLPANVHRQQHKAESEDTACVGIHSYMKQFMICALDMFNHPIKA